MRLKAGVLVPGLPPTQQSIRTSAFPSAEGKRLGKCVTVTCTLTVLTHCCRPGFPHPGCSLTKEHLSLSSPIGEPGTLVGPVSCWDGGAARGVHGRDLKAQVLLCGRESVPWAPLSGDWGGGCLRGRPVPSLESSPPSIHQACRDLRTAQVTWDRLRRREDPQGSRKAEVLKGKGPRGVGRQQEAAPCPGPLFAVSFL